MFYEVDYPPQFLIQKLESRKYSQAELQNIFPEISDFGFLNLDSETELRVINYAELEVLRAKRLCISCENRWYKGHECKNPCKVLFHPYDREDESDDEIHLDEKVQELEGKTDGKVQELEGKTDGKVQLDIDSSWKKGNSLDGCSFDQMIEGGLKELGDAGVSKIEGLKLCDDKAERKLEKDFIFSREILKADFTRQFRKREVRSSADLVKNGEIFLYFQNGWVVAGHEFIENLFCFINWCKEKLISACVHVNERHWKYKRKLSRIFQNNMKWSRKVPRLQFDPGKNLKFENSSIYFLTYLSYFRGFVITPGKSDCNALVSKLKENEIEEKMKENSQHDMYNSWAKAEYFDELLYMDEKGCLGQMIEEESGKIEEQIVMVKIWADTVDLFRIPTSRDDITNVNFAGKFIQLKDEIALLLNPFVCIDPNLVKLMGWCWEIEGEDVGVVYDLDAYNTLCNLVPGEILKWVDIIKTVKRVVYTSSASAVVFLDHGEDVVDDNPWSHPDIIRKTSTFGASYMVSKTLTEQAAWDFAEKNGIDFVSVISVFVNGPFVCPRVPGSVYSSSSMVFGDEHQYDILTKVQMVHVDDVASAYIYLFEDSEAKGRYNCSSIDVISHQISEFLSATYPEYPISTPEVFKDYASVSTNKSVFGFLFPTSDPNWLLLVY